MGNLSKASFFDAGANPPRKRVINVDGTRREERLPNGLVERWVDKQGNVVFQQLVASGLPVTVEAVDRARSEIRRRDGNWIEHHRCPLSQGTLEPDAFPTELQKICGKDTYGVDRPCVHVKHVVGERQAEQHERRRVRDASLNAEKLAKEARENQAIAAQNELNANIAKLIGAAAVAAAGQTQPPTSTPAPSSSSPDKTDKKKTER